MIEYVDTFSTVDWDGKIVATVFFSGCPFNCWYCHNRDLIKRGKVSMYDEVVRKVVESLDFIDGICITGGEPTMSRDELKRLIKMAKEYELKVKLDTNGYYPEVLEEVISDVDYIAMDVKCKFDEYKAIMIDLMNVDGDRLRRSADVIMSDASDYEFRTTVLECSKKWISDVAGQVVGAKRYVLQRLRVGSNFLCNVDDLCDVVIGLDMYDWFDEVKVR